MIIPFKNRVVNKEKPVYAYRNLNAKSNDERYSIMQNGLVVGHTDRVHIFSAKFVIRKSGKRKAIITGKRNVHGFVKGYLSNKNNEHTDIFYPVKYDSFNEYGFIYKNNGLQMDTAACVALLETQIMACNPTFFIEPEKYL